MNVSPSYYGAERAETVPVKPLKIVAFAFDSAEASQVRRLRRFMALGCDLSVFSMRRGNRAEPIKTDFPNIHLAWTEHEKLFKRVFTIIGSTFKTIAHRAVLRQADVIIARNLDMLAIAWAARGLARATAVPLVYECLDIHRSMTGTGWKARIFRKIERWLLARSQLLVVSSPRYITAYFEDIQGYTGPHAVWENLIVPDDTLPNRAVNRPFAAQGDILRLGWVGSIRCAPSLDLLANLARRLGPKIQIHIHGQVHAHGVPTFFDTVSAHDNMIYHGAYQYPVDLSNIYRTVDLVWNIDFWMRGGNSDWCLSNRIYEAGWAGRPSVALSGTEIGRYVQDRKMGWTVLCDDLDDLTAFFAAINREDLAKISADLLARPETDFVSDGRELDAVFRTLANGKATGVQVDRSQ